MAEEIDPRQVASMIRGLNKSPKGRRILQQAMREAGIDQPIGDVDKYANKAFSSARETAKAEGKGFFGQVRAGFKAARETQEQYQLATMGTKTSRERILNMLGIEVGDAFRKNFEKKGTPEEIAAAKERFKIDKKTKDKAKKEGGGESDFKSGRSINFILKNVLELKDMVRKIESLLTKPKLKAGFAFDPRLGASGGYRSTRGENKGRIVSAKEALAAPKVSKAEKAEAAKVSRTESLSKAILADEDPMVKLQESVLAILKSVGEDSKSIHDKLDELASQGGDSGFGLGDLLDIGTLRGRRGRRGGTRTKPKTKPKGRLKGIGQGLKTAGKTVGKFAKFIPGVGAVVAGGMAAYDGVSGYQNAGEILDLKEGEEATTGQKLSAAAGSVVSGLTFGLVDEKKVAQGIASATGAGPAPSSAPAPSSGPKFRLGPAAAKRGKIEASAGKNAALAAAGKAGITGAHLAQFMAQLDHESGHFTRVEENLRYSAKRLRQIFPKYYKTDADAAADEMQPQKIANRVYANRMGNGPPESGDGYKYRGRGLIQLTGKDNYKRFGSITGIDLVGNPDMAGNLGTAADIAAAFYKKNVMDRGIPAEDTKKVTKAINGGSIGLADRESLFASYMKDAGSLQPSAAPPATGEDSAEKPLYASNDQSLPESGGASAPQAAQSEAMTAQTSAPMPQATAAPTEALQPQQSTAGPAMAAASDQLAQNQMVAQNAPPPAPVVVNSGGGSTPSAPPSPKTPMAKAPTRSNDNSFTRALARDFSHPTAFTTVSMV